MTPEEFLKARILDFATVGKACFRTVFQQPRSVTAWQRTRPFQQPTIRFGLGVSCRERFS